MASFPLKAEYVGLDYGVPMHSLGNADEYGKVLYSERLFDVKLLKNSEGKNDACIPFRIVFFTNFELRKGFLVPPYWSFSIFDSYIAKRNENCIVWQTPDMSIIPLNKRISGQWQSNDGSFRLSEEKNGLITISGASGPNCSEFTYKDGLLSRITLLNNERKLAYLVKRTKNHMSLCSSQNEEILSVKKLNVPPPPYMDGYSVKCGNREAIFFIRKETVFSGKDRLEIPMVAAISRDGAVREMEYESNENVSKLTWGDGRFFKWKSSNGNIISDEYSSYCVDDVAGGVRISRKTVWNNLEYANKFSEGIIIVENVNHFLSYKLVKGVPSLSGQSRLIEYKNKSDSSQSYTIRNFFSPDGELLRSIKK